MVQYSPVFIIVLLAVGLRPHGLVALGERKNNPTATRTKPVSGSLHVEVSSRRYQVFQAVYVACFGVHNNDKGLLVHDLKIGEILSLSACCSLVAMSITTNQYAASITSLFITLHRVTPWSSSSAVRKPHYLPQDGRQAGVGVSTVNDNDGIFYLYSHLDLLYYTMVCLYPRSDLALFPPRTDYGSHFIQI